MQDFDRPTTLGIVFDLSQAHWKGQRILDHAKTAIVEVLGDIGLAGRIYVAHPQLQGIPKTMGESTYYAASYEEPPGFSIDRAFKDAVGVMGTQDSSGKNVVLITNRFQAPNNYRYRKGFLVNEIRDYDCAITIFGIGGEYDRITLASIAEEYGAKFHHLDSPESLGAKLKELIGA